MKKYTAVLIPIMLFLLCFYPSSISLAGDCGEAIIPTLSGNHKLNPTMHSTCSGEKPVFFSSSDEIEAGGSITLWVDCGDLARPPYNWSVSGTGYSINKSTTYSAFELITLTCEPGT